MTARRAHARRRYDDYLASRVWRERRTAWREAFVADVGAPPRCAVCDAQWSLADDLHHLDYQRLGHEEDTDLLPLCRHCHELIHQVLDHSRQWRRLPLRVASLAIVAQLRDALAHERHGS